MASTRTELRENRGWKLEVDFEQTRGFPVKKSLPLVRFETTQRGALTADRHRQEECSILLFQRKKIRNLIDPFFILSLARSICCSLRN